MCYLTLMQWQCEENLDSFTLHALEPSVLILQIFAYLGLAVHISDGHKGEEGKGSHLTW